MVYITGDTHGDLSLFKNPKLKKLNDDDILIICGDFGFLWDGSEKEQKAIEALCSDTPIFVTQSQVRSFIVSVSQEYSDDNLPIEIFDIGNLQEDDLSANEKIFYEL